MQEYLISIWQNIWPLSPIKILFSIFAIFAWSRAVLRFRAKQMNQKELAFWSFLWLAMIVVVLIPEKTTTLAKLLGMDRGFDAMTFIAIIALFYSVYRLYIKSNEVDQEITRIVRETALRLDVKKGRSKRLKRKIR